MEAEKKIKSDNYIQLRESEDILRLGIRDVNGKDTGNYLEFDLGDIELLTKYQEMLEEEKKNRANLKNQLLIIDKKQDHKGKKFLSYKEEAKIKAWQDFYRREAQVFDMFLGDNGVEKLLNGRKLNWTIIEEISEIIQKDIAPQLEITIDGMKKRIMKQYSAKEEKGVDIIE